MESIYCLRCTEIFQMHPSHPKSGIKWNSLRETSGWQFQMKTLGISLIFLKQWLMKRFDIFSKENLWYFLCYNILSKIDVYFIVRNKMVVDKFCRNKMEWNMNVNKYKNATLIFLKLLRHFKKHSITTFQKNICLCWLQSLWAGSFLNHNYCNNR